MQLHEQVCTLKQAKRLKELGVKQESYLQWFDYGSHAILGTGSILLFDTNPKDDANVCFSECSAFGVAEIGLMLPQNDIQKGEFTFFGKGVNGDWSIDCSLFDSPGLPEDGLTLDIEDRTEAETRAAMLIHLLENNLTTAQEVNDRLG